MGDKSPKPSEDQSTSTQNIWGPQADALEGLYGNAGDWYGGNNQGIQDASQQASNLGTGAVDAVRQPWLKNLQGGNLAGADIAGFLGGDLTNSMLNPSREQNIARSMGANNYADKYRQTFMDDAAGAQNQMLQGLDARAAASGMGGGSAYGNAVGMGMQDINSNLQSNLANVGYQDYERRAQSLQQAGANADQLRAGQQQQLGSLLGQQQDASSGAIGQQADIQNYINGPLQGIMQSAGGLQMLQSLLGSPQALTQQQSSANGGTAGSSGNFNVGGVGGGWS